MLALSIAVLIFLPFSVASTILIVLVVVIMVVSTTAPSTIDFAAIARWGGRLSTVIHFAAMTHRWRRLACGIHPFHGSGAVSVPELADECDGAAAASVSTLVEPRPARRWVPATVHRWAGVIPAQSTQQRNSMVLEMAARLVVASVAL